MKRFLLLSGPIVLFACLASRAQELPQSANVPVLPGSTQIPPERLRNTSGFEVLSKSNPQELRNYPFRVLAGVRNRWYPRLAELQKSGGLKRAMTVIEFEISRDGSVGDMRTVESAADASLDEAASQAISSASFPVLPDTYPEQKLRLRYHFGSNQAVGAETPICNGPNLGAHPADYEVRKVGNGVAAPHATMLRTLNIRIWRGR